MLSAGDHERLPKDKNKNDEDKVDLTEEDKKKLIVDKSKIPSHILYRLRKGIKPGKFGMLGERDGDLRIMKPASKQLGQRSPVKNDSMQNMLDFAKKNQGGFKLGKLPKRGK